MIRRQAAVAQMGFVAAALAFAGIGTGQPGGAGLLALAMLAVIAGWGIAAGAGWGRYLSVAAATACAGAGLFGLYGLVVLLGLAGYSGGTFSKANLVVLAVLLLMAFTFVVLLVSLLDHQPSDDLIDIQPRGRATLVGVGFAVGIAASVAFSSALSSVAEPPCCSA